MSEILRTHYSNLQVVENASDEVIKGAYKYLAQKHHPDRNPGKEEECTKILQVISKAYEVLSNPELRRRHDEWIKHKREESKHESNPNDAIDKNQTQKTSEFEYGHNQEQELPIGAIQCPSCREFIGPSKIKRGSTIVNALLFLFFWPAWMIHFLYAYGYKEVCPECGYEIRSDRKKAGIIMGSIVGVLAIIVVWAVVSHVPYAPGCNDHQVKELVLQIANESIDYPQIGLRNTLELNRDTNTGMYHCKGQLYAKDNAGDFIDITYSSEPSKENRDEFYVRVEGI